MAHGAALHAGDSHELKLQYAQPGSMTIDICFMLDITGSMRPWLEACKAQLREIAASIAPRILKEYPSLDITLRYGMVAYRDVCDGSNQFNVLDFTDADALHAKVCSGGNLRRPASAGCNMLFQHSRATA